MIGTLVRRWVAITLFVVLLVVAFSVTYGIWASQLDQIQREMDVIGAMYYFRKKQGHYPSTVTELFEVESSSLPDVSVNELTIVKSSENSVTLSLSVREAWGSGNSELIKLEYNVATGSPPQWVTIDGKRP